MLTTARTAVHLRTPSVPSATATEQPARAALILYPPNQHFTTPEDPPSSNFAAIPMLQPFSVPSFQFNSYITCTIVSCNAASIR